MEIKCDVFGERIDSYLIVSKTSGLNEHEKKTRRQRKLLPAAFNQIFALPGNSSSILCVLAQISLPQWKLAYNACFSL